MFFIVGVQRKESGDKRESETQRERGRGGPAWAPPHGVVSGRLELEHDTIRQQAVGTVKPRNADKRGESRKHQ